MEELLRLGEELQGSEASGRYCMHGGGRYKAIRGACRDL